jgi:inner membrane protein COX18
VPKSATPRNYHDIMASIMMRRPAGQLLSSGFKARPKAGCRPSARAFHASAPRHDPLLDAVLYLPHEMMNLIHSSVPWYAAIPISAFVTRGLLVTTAGAWARSLTARYVGLQPLRQALAFQKRDEILRRGNFRDPKQAVVAIKKEVNDEVAKLDSRWKVTLRGQISWTFAQIPIFIAMAECIRQKCGARDGFMGMTFSAIKREDTSAVVDTLGVTPSTWFDPSLANEGMLWFQDLLLPDPTGALPYVVAGLMFTNIYITPNTVQSDGSWPLTIRRTLLGVAFLIGPLCQNVPAALLLYWGASTSSVMLWNAWLDWKYPAPRGYTACKRPLQMPPIPRPRGRRV